MTVVTHAHEPWANFLCIYFLIKLITTPDFKLFNFAFYQRTPRFADNKIKKGARYMIDR